MNTYWQTARRWFIPFIQVQFFLSLISLPILIAWGLPFSLLTMIGNLVFAPFLTLFLLCSSLVFFTEILHIPNQLCLWMLEKITLLWLWCLQWGSKSWMIGFKISTLPFSILAAILAIAILQHTRWGKKNISALLYTVLFCLVLLTNRLISTPAEMTVTCNKKTVSVYNKNNKLTFIDNGGLGEKINPTSWISYTLLNTLTKQFGTIYVDTVYVNQSKLPTLDALHTLCQEIPVETIVFLKPQKIDWRSKKYIKKIINEKSIIKTMYHSQTKCIL